MYGRYLTAAEIQTLEQDKLELERQVAEQNLTPDEVARMNSERSTLSESIRELTHELHKKTRELGEQEIAVARRMDDIDSLVNKYTHGKAVIGLNASSVQQQYEIDFNVDVNMASSDLTAVNIVGQRIKESIRPGLQTFGETLRTEWRGQSNQKIEWDDKLDRLNSELEQRRHHVQTLELKLASLESAAEAEKQVSRRKLRLACSRLTDNSSRALHRNFKRKLRIRGSEWPNLKPTSVPCPCRANKSCSQSRLRSSS